MSKASNTPSVIKGEFITFQDIIADGSKVYIDCWIEGSSVTITKDCMPYSLMGCYFCNCTIYLHPRGPQKEAFKGCVYVGDRHRFEVLEDQPTKCTCKLRTMLFGNGCAVCNPNAGGLQP